jgi:hypothetical protein
VTHPGARLDRRQKSSDAEEQHEVSQEAAQEELLSALAAEAEEREE